MDFESGREHAESGENVARAALLLLAAVAELLGPGEGLGQVRDVLGLELAWVVGLARFGNLGVGAREGLVAGSHVELGERESIELGVVLGLPGVTLGVQ